MSRRLMRLNNDYRNLSYLCDRCEYIKISALSGNPPEQYNILFKIKGLLKTPERLIFSSSHNLEILLPREYPSSMPLFRFKADSPVFHPNVAPHNHPTMPPFAVCLVDHWTAGQNLLELVIKTAKMLCFQQYNLNSTLNGEASLWVRDNLSMLPLTHTNFDQFFVSAPSDYTPKREGLNSEMDSQTSGPLHEERDGLAAPGQEPVSHSVCRNCGASAKARPISNCINGHMVCTDCMIPCSSCGMNLCVFCEEVNALKDTSPIKCRLCSTGLLAENSELKSVSTRNIAITQGKESISLNSVDEIKAFMEKSGYTCEQTGDTWSVKNPDSSMTVYAYSEDELKQIARNIAAKHSIINLSLFHR